MAEDSTSGKHFNELYKVGKQVCFSSYILVCMSRTRAVLVFRHLTTLNFCRWTLGLLIGLFDFFSPVVR